MGHTSLSTNNIDYLERMLILLLNQWEPSSYMAEVKSRSQILPFYRYDMFNVRCQFAVFEQGPKHRPAYHIHSELPNRHSNFDQGMRKSYRGPQLVELYPDEDMTGCCPRRVLTTFDVPGLPEVWSLNSSQPQIGLGWRLYVRFLVMSWVAVWTGGLSTQGASISGQDMTWNVNLLKLEWNQAIHSPDKICFSYTYTRASQCQVCLSLRVWVLQSKTVNIALADRTLGSILRQYCRIAHLLSLETQSMWGLLKLRMWSSLAMWSLQNLPTAWWPCQSSSMPAVCPARALLQRTQL